MRGKRNSHGRDTDQHRRDREIERERVSPQRDRETKRQRDGEMERWRDGEREREPERERERQRCI